VCPGDYVIADDDGICLVPFEDFPAVVASATSAQAAEDVLVEAIRTSTDIEDLVTRTKVPRVPD
jgi:4-hydroxy-4-methyl-2-oxoglutarate aldolase